MANVYILYSKKLNRYYTGSCLDLEKRAKLGKAIWRAPKQI
ncbi:MAG: GIY-YIG nuclease family protein [Chitinophagaceae bacterium]|nr:GIY-YIG nuclease family protein [Chitinophagaceae bacterium]